MTDETKKRKKDLNMTAIYFSDADFATICKDTADAGFRPVLLLPKKQKEHGFAGEMVIQRKGVSKFLKFCWKYYKDHEAERVTKLAELKTQEKLIEEQKKKLGLEGTGL